MQTFVILIILSLLQSAKIFISATILEQNTATSSPQIESASYDHDDEYDNESARKIIGSRVVTSVSVVMNGKEPQFADAVGNYVPRPLVPPRVASPVSLLDPDRYEFYTFNDDGELVKRLMTMEEIQGIVANGDSEQQVLAKNPTGIIDNEANIRDIVKNVQKVLHSEMANNNFTTNLMYNKLDTPDTSSSWSSILPAIFGNTGESILSNNNKIPMGPGSGSGSGTTGSTADSIIMQTTTTNKKPLSNKTPSTTLVFKTTPPTKAVTTAQSTTASKITKQKPKPSRPNFSSTAAATLGPNNVASQKIKFSSTSQKTTQNIKNTITPSTAHIKHQYQNSPQNTISITKPTKSNIATGKPASIPSKPSSTIYVQKVTQTTNVPSKIASSSIGAVEATVGATKKPISKYPTTNTQSKYPSSALKTSPSSMTYTNNFNNNNNIHTTKLPPYTFKQQITTTTKKDKITNAHTVSPSQHSTNNKYITTLPTKKKTSGTTASSNYKTTTKITTPHHITTGSSSITTAAAATATAEANTPKENLITSASTVKYIKTNSQPMVTTTRRTDTSPIHPTTPYSPIQTVNPDAAAIIEPEPDNIFDSELSLNQIIESLKDLEGTTTIPYASNFMDMVDLTTFEPSDSTTISPFDKMNSESVTIVNNGQNANSPMQYFTHKNEGADFKQPVNSVSYIPQTTMDQSPLSFIQTTEVYNQNPNYVKKVGYTSPTHLQNHHHHPVVVGIEHKEGDDDDMILDEKTTTIESTTNNMPDYVTTTENSGLSKHSTNSMMDNLLRESFDSVLSQVQNDNNGLSTTIDYNENMESTTLMQTTMQDFSTTPKAHDTKKVAVVQPTPYIPAEELDGVATEPMKYLEAIIKKHYEQEQSKNELIGDVTTPHKFTSTNSVTTDKSDIGPMTTTTSLTTDFEITEISTNGNTVYDETLSTEQKLEAETTTELNQNHEITPEPQIQQTTQPEEISTVQYDVRDSLTEKQENIVPLKFLAERYEDEFTTVHPDSNDAFTTAVAIDSFSGEHFETTTDFESLDQTTATVAEDFSEQTGSGFDENQTQYEMIQLIENIVKNITNDKASNNNLQPNTTNSIERKEDASGDLLRKTTDETTDTHLTTALQNLTTISESNEIEFSNLGETTTATATTAAAATKISNSAGYTTVEKIRNETKPKNITTTPPHSHHPLSKLKITPTLAPILNNLKMKVVNALKNTNTIKLDPAPKQALGLEESTAHAGEDILEFTRFCNEVAFNFWTVYNDGISSARSLTLSPFALTSMLAMLFLGARGRTSGEIDSMLHLDDIVTFNPHAMLRNISESVDSKRDGNVFSNAFIREWLSERSKGKILPFFKEKVSQFYSGYVEEVNFSTVNDIIRRRTNLLMKRHTGGKVNEYLKTNNVWVKPPLSGISANHFETDCSKASKVERDGEMFFQVLPAIRQRRLVPIPAVVWKSGFTAGYDPELDATAVAIGLSKNIVSTIFVMPGQQGHSAPGDNLERLESVLMVNAVSQNAWRRLLATLMERPGLEVQIPRFTHRSFVNTTSALRKLGLETLFDQNSADLRGITGSIARDMYVSDLIQINTFSTCGEDRLPEEHHTELYPAPPNKHRTMEYSTSTTTIKANSENVVVPIVDYENERAFASDPIYDLKYLSLPLPLRPRQARIPEAPRLRFDKPFIYFVRHNPTGMVLYFGRFNPRLLP